MDNVKTPQLWSQQSLRTFEETPLSLQQMKHCELIAGVIISYRLRSNFLTSHCWMDEWATGYFCALRDAGQLNLTQWQLLCSAFQPEDL